MTNAKIKAEIDIAGILSSIRMAAIILTIVQMVDKRLASNPINALATR